MSIEEVKKEEHSKNAIFVWYAFGVYALLFGKMHGIFPFLIYFPVGIFIASFASIITYIIRPILLKIIPSADLVIIIFFIIDVLWIIFIGNLFLNAINNFFAP